MALRNLLVSVPVENWRQILSFRYINFFVHRFISKVHKIGQGQACSGVTSASERVSR